MDSLREWAHNIANTTRNIIGEHGFVILSILVTAIILYYVGTFLVGAIVKKLVIGAHYRHWHRKDIEKRQNTLAGLATSIWKIMVVLVSVFTILPLLFPSINIAPLFASAGILGVALGFGAQSLVRDFLSGIFIISENQYRVGDVIEVDGASGTVERIGTRSTVIRDFEGNVHYFPNGMVMHVINKTMGYSMARFKVSVHPDSDLEKVIGLINAVGEELAGEEKWQSKIIETPQFIAIDDFTAGSVVLIVSGKVEPSDQWSVTSEMRRRIIEVFEQSHIKLSPDAAPPTSKKKR